MIQNKINIWEYLNNLNNLKTLIISEGSFHLKNIKRFTKTLRELIDDNFRPEYKLLLPSKITMEIGKTIQSIILQNEQNYYMVQRQNFKVRSYDLHNLSLLLKNTELMLEYFGDIIFNRIEQSGLLGLVKFYQHFFLKLNSDVLKYIFEFSCVPFLKFQKQIEQSSEKNFYILKHLLLKNILDVFCYCKLFNNSPSI